MALKLAISGYIAPSAQPRRPRGRPRGVGYCRQRTRLAIAEQILAGKPMVTIAKELGVSRSWASREAYAPQTQSFLALFLQSQAERISQILATALDAVEQALQARKIVNFRGRSIDLGPDHRIRLRAVGLLVRILRLPQRANSCFFRHLNSIAATRL